MHLFHVVTKLGRFESVINVCSGKTYVLQCILRLFCLSFFFFLSWEVKSWSKPLNVVKGPTQLRDQISNRWMITDFEIIAKTSRPLNLHFWFLWAPQARSELLTFSRRVKTARLPRFKCSFIIYLKKFVKNYLPLDAHKLNPVSSHDFFASMIF